MTPPDFSDHFSGQAAEYAKFRPRYPEALFEYLAGFGINPHGSAKLTPEPVIRRVGNHTGVAVRARRQFGRH